MNQAESVVDVQDAEAPVVDLQVIQPAQQHKPPAVITPENMLAMAVERGSDLAIIEQLMNLRQRHKDETAREAFYAAFAAFKSEAIEIIKRKRVHYTGQKGTVDYKHAELSDIHEAVSPALSRNGLSVNFQIKQARDWIDVTCTLRHALGFSESVTMGGPPDGSGNKNPVQQIASTKTMLERQTMKAILGVAEKGDDDDGRGGAGNGPEDHRLLDAEVLLDDLTAEGLKTKTDKAALDFWNANNGKLGKFPKLHKRLKDAIADHRTALKGGTQ
jgi:hypothetical protein